MSHPKTLAMTSYDHVAVSHPGPSINTPPILCDRSPQRSAARYCLASSSRAATVRLETSCISQEGRAKSRTLPDTPSRALPSVSPPKQNRETARVVGEWSKPAETLSRALSFFLQPGQYTWKTSTFSAVLTTEDLHKRVSHTF